MVIKQKIVNALGGITTKKEKEVYQSFTKKYSYERKDTYRGKVVKANDDDTYNIQLYPEGTIIYYIPAAIKTDIYLSGTEVILGYISGRKQEIVILGKVFGRIPKSGSSTTSTAPSSSPALAKSKFVVFEDIDDYISGVYDYSSELPQSKLHSNLSGDELHNPKPDVNQRLQSLRLNIVDVADVGDYAVEGTVILVDTGATNELHVYINGGWETIL